MMEDIDTYWYLGNMIENAHKKSTLKQAKGKLKGVFVQMFHLIIRHTWVIQIDHQSRTVQNFENEIKLVFDVHVGIRYNYKLKVTRYHKTVTRIIIIMIIYCILYNSWISARPATDTLPCFSFCKIMKNELS